MSEEEFIAKLKFSQSKSYLVHRDMYDRLRALIVHEDTLRGQRLGFFSAVQALLLVAWSQRDHFTHGSLTIPLLGLASVVMIAFWQVQSNKVSLEVIDEWTAYPEHTKFPKLIGKHLGKGTFGRLAFAPILPLLFALVWVINVWNLVRGYVCVGVAPDRFGQIGDYICRIGS